MSALLACAALATTPAPADWLVTTDGARIETKGPWKVEGRRVLFTQPNGTLSAMRASEIDFEASEAATSAALAPPPSAAEESVKEPLPEPVLVLTNKDIAAAQADGGDGEPKPETLPSIADREPVQVVSWKRFDVEEGVELRGAVRNTGASVAANIRVQATVKDEEGNEIATGNAFLGSSSLVSGRSSTFRIVLPEVDDFDGNPEFRVTSSRVTIGGAARPRTQAEDADDADTDAGNDPDSADDGLSEEEGEGEDEDIRP
ncbi:MAG: hypothetical protein AAGM22_11235 [Acidobacteriota bacterium]